MKKTKLGISVGLLGAAVYFMALYGGYVITVLLAGYVLLFEENQWLKKSAIKAVALMVFFSILATFIYLIPNAINVIDGIVGTFGGSLYINSISNLTNAAGGALDIVEKFLFIGLGCKALTQGYIAVPAVDNFIDKYME